MGIPLFLRENINPGLCTDDVGSSFQNFAHQLLEPEFPCLVRFPAGGKDGCIDLVQDLPGDRLVIECKHIGDGGVAEARKRWQEVADKLETHLADPKGPTKGQSQYRPWYETDLPIRRFRFCISCSIVNTDRRDQLNREIRQTFVTLASSHSHLSHLANLSTNLLDWGDLETRLRKNLHLLFRWFPATRPFGLVPLDEIVEAGTLRSYLSSAKLPYYSRSHHLAAVPAPAGVDIPGEDALLDSLEGGQFTGLVVTGAGGVGKTRLSLEIGRRAQERGWTVLRVRSRLHKDSLDALGERLTPAARVLLVIDYIETQRDFAELVEILNDLNDTFRFNVRYLANCRTSYYQAVAATSRHREVDISPHGLLRAEDWFEGYRSETVRHILGQSGLEVSEKHLAVCRDIPVLAVLLTYLHATGRGEELEGLLEEEDFARWVAKRVQLSFPGASTNRKLATLMALFPLPDAFATQGALQEYRALLDPLAADGWVEKLGPSATSEGHVWATAHDVLADQVVLSYLRTIPQTVEHFAEELLTFATSAGCLRSALLSLQRLADQPAVKTVDWSPLVARQMDSHPGSWREVRDLVVRIPLLNPAERIALLAGRDDIWGDAEEEVGFQNAIGWLARWAVEEGAEIISPDHRTILTSWVERAARRVSKSNFVLTWGIQFAPESVHGPALEWILARPGLFQTHYLLVAWLEKGLPSDEIKDSVMRWMERFPADVHLSFVVRAWLEANGELELVREPIQGWLKKHAAILEAQFVYFAWLEAKGELELVREPIREWLKEQAATPEAGFVYHAWLDAKGELELVREPIREWLKDQAATPEAGFVYHAWLDAKGELELVREPIRRWLKEQAATPEAGFVYHAWLDAKGELELVREPIRGWLKEQAATPEAGFVYRAWLDAKGELELVLEPIRGWLKNHAKSPEAGFVYRGWLDAKGELELVHEPIREWLEEHAATPDAQFVYRAWLDAKGELELVREPIREWLKEHAATAEAGFVHRAWLDAGGEKESIEAWMKNWLALHGRAVDADFLFRAWLDAGGDFSVIREPALHWLSENYDKPEASYLTKKLAKQPDLPAETVSRILAWRRKFRGDEDALWRLTQLGRHLLNNEVAEEVLSTCETVLHPLLSASGPVAVVAKGQIATVFSYLMDGPGLRAGEIRTRVDTLFVAWLRNPSSYGVDPKAHLALQRRTYFVGVGKLLESGALALPSDRDALERFLRWVNTWEPRWKAPLRPDLAWLKQHYPEPGLWEILEIPEEPVHPETDSTAAAP